MKQLILLFFTITIKAQTVYYGRPSMRGAEIHINKDNTYKITLGQGTYTKKIEKGNEYFVLNKLDKKENYTVIADTQGERSEFINVHFPNQLYEADYIGYKTKESDNYVYLNTLIETKIINPNNDRNEIIRIPYGTRYMRICIQRNNKFYFFTYKIPKKTKNIYCNYDRGYFTGSKVFAMVKNGEIKVNDRMFKKEPLKGTYLASFSYDSIMDSKISRKVQIEAYKKIDNKAFIYKPISTIGSFNNSETKPKEFKNIEEAFYEVKKDDSKILLVFNQLLNNNAKEYVNEIIKNIEYYKKQYNNNFIVYLSKFNERKKVEKYGYIGINSIAAFNSNLDVIYRAETDLSGRSYELLSGLKKVLPLVNMVNQFVRKDQRNELTIKDFLPFSEISLKNIDLLYKILSIKEYESKQVFIHRTRNYYKELSNDLTIIKNSRILNFSTSNFKKKLEFLLEKHKNDKELSLDFGKLALNYIIVDPRYKKLAGNPDYGRTELDFKFAYYLSRFGKKANTIKLAHPYYESTPHIWKIIQMFDRNLYTDKYPDLILGIYKNIISFKGYDVIYAYKYFSTKVLLKKDFYHEFDKFFNQFLNQENLTEFLEKYLTENGFEKYHSSKIKEEGIELCNYLAWKVVKEKNQDRTFLNKAVKWSEITLKEEPNNHYYIDTQANLQYYLGNKEKAIELETRAVKFAKSDKDSKGYQRVLEQMKNNTLKH